MKIICETLEINNWACNANIANNFDIYIYPVIASVIAAFIFWFAFSKLIEHRLRKKFSKTIRLDLQDVLQAIRTLLDGCFRYKDNSPSPFQQQIYANTMSMDEITLYLKSKSTYKNYALTNYPIKIPLKDIGANFIEAKEAITAPMQRLYSVSIFIDPDHFGLVRSAHKAITQYVPHMESANPTVGGFMIVDPSASYLKQNIFQLMQIQNELCGVIANDYYHEDDISQALIYYLGRDDAHRAKKLLTTSEKVKNSPKAFAHYWLHIAVIFAKNGNVKKAVKFCQKYLSFEANPVASRHIIKTALEYDYLEATLKTKISEGQILNIKLQLDSEETKKLEFINFCKENEDKLSQLEKMLSRFKPV